MKTRLSHFYRIGTAVKFAAVLAALGAFNPQTALSQNLPTSGAGDPFCHLLDEANAEEQAGRGYRSCSGPREEAACCRR